MLFGNRIGIHAEVSVGFGISFDRDTCCEGRNFFCEVDVASVIDIVLPCEIACAVCDETNIGERFRGVSVGLDRPIVYECGVSIVKQIAQIGGLIGDDAVLRMIVERDIGIILSLRAIGIECDIRGSLG